MAEPSTCPVCAPLARAETIASPDELWRMLARVREALAAKQLVETTTPEQAGRGASGPKSETLVQGEALPDWLHLSFACTGCGRHFELGCETYHGSGGWWRGLRDER